MTTLSNCAKVDLNAQQWQLTGGVIEGPDFSCVVVEGGPKALQKYKRLMLVRMKWTGGDDDDVEDENKTKFNPDNKCEIVWEGMAAKRNFRGFVFQECETADDARKILKAKGVEHYWDQVEQHAAGQGGQFQLRLAFDDSKDAAENPYEQNESDDIVMQE